LTPLGKAKKEAADYLEALQRERAEFVNFRNRASKEQDRFRQHGIIDVLTALLPALDDLDRIREHGEMSDDLTAVANKLDRAFEKFGVEKFGEKGEDFDPTKHEAILHKPDATATKESVDTVVEAGYKVGDRVVRAARVVVTSPSGDDPKGND
jgi:molecular chaperone GrpE